MSKFNVGCMILYKGKESEDKRASLKRYVYKCGI